ncbi:Ethanolamine kinase [Balamuthia mandrillaris]
MIESRYPAFQYSIDPEQVEEGALVVFRHFFPNFTTSREHLKQFTDGITNKLFKVIGEVETEEEAGDACTRRRRRAVLVRVYGKNTEVLIDRDRELRTLVLLAEAGFSPPLYGRFLNGMCYGYVDGVPFKPADMQAGEKWPLVARKLAAFHRVRHVGPREPTLFRTIRKWLDEIPTSYPDPEQDRRFKQQFNKEQALRELDMMEEELVGSKRNPKLPPPSVVFCHNDLLCANLLYQQSSPRTSADVAFIDFEYGSYNYRAFDIANHFCEMMGYNVDPTMFPSREFRLQWLRTYLTHYHRLERQHQHQNESATKKGTTEGEEEREESLTEEELEALEEDVLKFTVAAHFHWGTWALVQARYSDLAAEFDYIGYSALLFGQFHHRKRSVLGCFKTELQ